MKYYWLRINRDFLKRHDVTLLRKKYGFKGFYIYMTLLLESIDHEGQLRFSDDIPYTLEDLAYLTETTEILVDEVLQYLYRKKLAYLTEDGTIVMQYAISNIGSESESAERVRRFRRKQDKPLQSNEDVTESNDNVRECNTEIEIELEKEIETKNTPKPKIKESDACEIFFNECWELYPNKKGKGRISLTMKQKAYKFGDEFVRAVRRYANESRGKEKQFIQHGGTFFNKGYVDYLDKNYERTDGVAKLPDEIKEEKKRNNEAKEIERVQFEKEQKKHQQEYLEKHPEYSEMTVEELIEVTAKNLGKVKGKW